MSSPRRIVGFNDEQHAAMLMLLADLECPVSFDGATVVPELFSETIRPVYAYHLTRRGYRLSVARSVIKRRRVYGSGTLAGAVAWVPMSAPDDPLANVENMSIAEINALEPEDVRNEARRRVGLPVDAPRRVDGWHVQTAINISDEPDSEE